MSILNFEELINIYHYIIPIDIKLLDISNYTDGDDYEYMKEDIYLFLKMKLNQKNRYLNKINDDLYIIIPNKRLSYEEYKKIINDTKNIPNNVFSIRKFLYSKL